MNIKTCFILTASLIMLAFPPVGVEAQTAWFIDGYHGGVYGHYPEGQTAFIVQALKENPDWRINLEIEPETWETVRQRDPEAYEAFRELFKDQSPTTGRIEYVNPTYAQSYFFATSGESAIRQFHYGIQLLRKHFPEAIFTSYSAEEPCFTSCLPYLLKSFGLSYASTKSPNTMWGGYVKAYGNGPLNWIGPDGTRLLTVPRYACEDFLPGSTWQTIGWYNSKEYIRKCFDAGIRRPVGMCIQDAAWSHGWNKGPWLGKDTASFHTPSVYTTWRHYFQNDSTGETIEDWHFSQEDVLPGLMWGTQVMQKLSQEVRVAENNILQAEKIAALSHIFAGTPWPEEQVNEGWRTLLLSQHHDCWIVPYNRLQAGKTWAETVTDWTESTNALSNQIIKESLQALNPVEGKTAIRVYNTLGIARNETVKIRLPASLRGKTYYVIDKKGVSYPTQLIEEQEATFLLFRAQVPPVGSSTYRLKEKPVHFEPMQVTENKEEGTLCMESDLYRLIIDARRGGTIRSLQVKGEGNRELVDTSDDRAFNELRGYFVREGRYISSTEQKADVRVARQGARLTQIVIDGHLGEHPFQQTISLVSGEKKISMSVKIDWQGSPLIGEPTKGEYKAENPRKAFYDDSYKLLIHFPTHVSSAEIYKNAPFDICKSRHTNSCYNRWDEIKHNIVLDWVDIYNPAADNGLALFTDHTTSYVHTNNIPLALTLQYAGKGLWGRDYTLTRPTEINYTLLPHRGRWEQARLWTAAQQNYEPLLATFVSDSAPANDLPSLFSIEEEAYELVSMTCQGDALYLRLFNAQSDNRPRTITFHCRADSIELVELNDRVICPLRLENGKVQLSIPPLGIRTIKLVNPARASTGSL